MLSFFFAYFLISLISLVSGYLLDYHFQTTFYKKYDNHYKPFLIYLLTGLISLTIFGEWIALFFPCNFWVTIAVTALLFLVTARKWSSHQPFFSYCLQKIKTTTVPHIFLLTAIGLLILIINAGPTLMDDTESYHIQMVKWIQEYGSPKGIANLHSRYGFNSAWFTSIALFSIPSSSLNTYTLLNGLLSFWFCSYLVNMGFKAARKELNTNVPVAAAPYFIVLCIVLLLWPIIRGSAGTSNYDLISSVMVLGLFAELIATNKLSQSYYLQWIMFPLFIFTVRIINYPFLLLTVFLLFIVYKKRDYKTLLFTVLAGTVIIAPFLIRNLFLSGYLFYPSPAFDLFEVDWKVEAQVLVDLLYFIKYFNRVNDMYLPISYTASIGFPEWTILWYKHLFKYDKVLVNLSGIALILSLFFTKKIWQTGIEVKYYCAVIIISMISWFLIAPDPRFAYGSILCIIFFVSFLFFSTKHWYPFLSLKLLVVLLGLIILSFAIIKTVTDSSYRNWFTPFPLREPPVQTIVHKNIQYYIPEKIPGNWNKRCYGTSLPCLYELNPKLTLRGREIKEGFKVSNKEK